MAAGAACSRGCRRISVVAGVNVEMQSSNPVLSRLGETARVERQVLGTRPAERTMTLDDVVVRTVALLVLTGAAGAVVVVHHHRRRRRWPPPCSAARWAAWCSAWSSRSGGSPTRSSSALYAVLEGVLLGVVSRGFEAALPGHRDPGGGRHVRRVLRHGGAVQVPGAPGDAAVHPVRDRRADRRRRAEPGQLRRRTCSAAGRGSRSTPGPARSAGCRSCSRWSASCVGALTFILDFDAVEQGIALRPAGEVRLVLRVRPAGRPDLPVLADPAPAELPAPMSCLDELARRPATRPSTGWSTRSPLDAAPLGGVQSRPGRDARRRGARARPALADPAADAEGRAAPAGAAAGQRHGPARPAARGRGRPGRGRRRTPRGAGAPPPTRRRDRERAVGSALDSRSTIMAMPWPPPTHIVSRPIVLSCHSSELISVPVMRAPVMPNGWPTAIAPPFTLSFSIGMPRSPVGRDDLRRERLVDLDQVDVVDGHAGPRERLPGRLDRAEAHDLRRQRGDAGGDDPGQRRDARARGPSRRSSRPPRRRRR